MEYRKGLYLDPSYSSYICYHWVMNNSINFHCYADDTQLYLSIKPGEQFPLVKLRECLTDIKTWMTCNFLLLNSDKTEVIILGTQHLRNKLSNNIIYSDGITLTSSTTVKNLGVIFDEDLSFKSHIKQISRTAYFHLRNIAKIRHILNHNNAETLIHAFIRLSKLIIKDPSIHTKRCSTGFNRNKEDGPHHSCFSSIALATS